MRRSSSSSSAVLLTAAWALAAVPAAAQSPLTVSLRAGATLPRDALETAFGDALRIEPDVGFGVHFGLRRSGVRSFQVGFSQYRFRCGACADSGELVLTSWDAGLRLAWPGGSVRPWIDLGVTLGRTEDTVSLRDGRVSDLGVGGQLGAGVGFGPWGRLSLSPGVRYASLGAGFEDVDVDVRFFTVDLALVVGF